MDGLTAAFDPERVRAIVVDLESCTGREMSGPAPDAPRFCAWLRSRGVQPDRIGLWLSASPDRLADREERAEDLDVVCRQARSRDQLMDAFIRDLEEQEGHDTPLSTSSTPSPLPTTTPRAPCRTCSPLRTSAMSPSATTAPSTRKRWRTSPRSWPALPSAG